MNGLQEMCYLPTWPVGFPPMGRPPCLPLGRPPPGCSKPLPETLTSFDFRTMVLEGLAEEMGSIIDPDPDEWIRPQPKCVRRVDWDPLDP